MLEKIYQTGRPLSRTEEDGKSWLRKPKLYKWVVEPYKKKTIEKKWDLSLYNLNFKISRHVLQEGNRPRLINYTIYLPLVMYFCIKQEWIRRHFSWLKWALTPGLKRWDHTAGHTPQCIAQAENAWSDIATPIFFNDVQMNNFTALCIHNLFATVKEICFRDLIKPSPAFLTRDLLMD